MLPKEGTVALASISGFGEVPLEGPVTAYRISAAGFLARPDAARGTDIDEGLLRLSGKSPAFEVVQNDVDGGAIKLLDHAANLARHRTIQPASVDDAQSLPAGRSTGLTVARRGRAKVTKAAFAMAKTLDGTKSPTVYADDVRRGYRVDVYRAKTNKWYSLVARGGAYSVGAKSFAPGDAEGYVKSSGGTSEVGETGPTSRLYVHEALFGWDGWSLAARRPGKTIVDPLGKTDDVANAPALGVPVSTEWRVTPGTLPKLRYGEHYRFRARVVDLAGNSLPFSDVTSSVMPAEAPSDLVRYERYEPIAAPALVPQRRFGEGESLERLVIRGDRDVPPEAYGSGLTLPDGSPRYVPFCFRHVAPPKTSQSEAELHGALDAFDDPAKKHHVSSREEGTFLDTTIIDVETGDKVPFPGGVLVTKTPGRSLETLKKGEALGDGEYVLRTADAMPLPYLPDPAAGGIALAAEALREDELSPRVAFPFPSEWLAAAPGSFRVVAGKKIAIKDLGNGRFEVQLPPATILPAKLSSLPRPGEAEKLALWDYAVSGDAKGTVAGKNWTITPARQLTFVHAVQHPLEPALIKKLYGPSRAPGQTGVVVRGDYHCHARSTSEIEMHATWLDLVDPTGEDKWRTEPHAGRAFVLSIPYEVDDDAIGGNKELQGELHELGDTKHRNIVYQPNSASRYREYFPLEVIADPRNLTTDGLLGEAGAILPTDPSTPYFRSGMLSVPSSARPVPPKVLYVVPTFRWQSSDDGRSQTRVGRGLRIYLDRPWFTTGVGERLAVLVTPSSPDARKYVSEWGSDPLWTAQTPKVDLAPSHFADVTYPAEAGEEATHPERTYKRVLGPYPLAEGPELFAMAVALMPEYDEGRRLWFVDLELDPGPSYFPFVRLALARCQPDSLYGLELSPVVKAEFAQLVADRTATVVVGATIDVAVSGIVALNAYGAFVAGWKPPTIPVATGGATSGGTGIPVTGNVGNVDNVGTVGGTGGSAGTLIEIADPKAGAGRRVTATLQRRKKSDGDLAWATLGDELPLASYRSLLSEEIMFRGSLPSGPLKAVDPGIWEHRVLIREYEQYQADTETNAGSSVGERVVYAAEMRVGG